MHSKGSSHTALLISVLIALVVGFLIGNISSSFNKISQPLSNLVSSDKLYTNQTATVKGQIKSLEGNKIMVQNSEGVSGSLELADSVLINVYKKNSKSIPIASPSTDLKTIELNKDATINLSKINGTFKVVAIDFASVPPPLPSLPPVPKK